MCSISRRLISLSTPYIVLSICCWYVFWFRSSLIPCFLALAASSTIFISSSFALIAIFLCSIWSFNFAALSSILSALLSIASYFLNAVFVPKVGTSLITPRETSSIIFAFANASASSIAFVSSSISLKNAFSSLPSLMLASLSLAFNWVALIASLRPWVIALRNCFLVNLISSGVNGLASSISFSAFAFFSRSFSARNSFSSSSVASFRAFRFSICVIFLSAFAISFCACLISFLLWDFLTDNFVVSVLSFDASDLIFFIKFW